MAPSGSFYARDNQTKTNLQDDQFQLRDVVGMHPVLGRLADEVLLLSSRGAVSLGRVPSRADKIIELGKLHNEGIIVVLEERLGLETGREDRFEIPSRLFLPLLATPFEGATDTHIVLLDDLLKARVVQLGELGQVMHVGDDIAQVLLEQNEILVRGRGLAMASGGLTVEAGDDLVDLALAGLDAADDLLTLDALEGEDLVELALEQGDEALLVLLGPGLALGLGAVGGGLGDVLGLESFLEVFVGDVVPPELLDHGRPELLAEPGAERDRVSIGSERRSHWTVLTSWWARREDEQSFGQQTRNEQESVRIRQAERREGAGIMASR